MRDISAKLMAGLMASVDPHDEGVNHPVKAPEYAQIATLYTEALIAEWEQPT